MVVLQSAPDATTLLKSRHLLEKHKPGDQLFGVDSQSGLTHSAVMTSANFHDKRLLPDSLHGQE